MLFRFIVTALVIIALSGCSSSSRVILLDNGKAHSAVVVKTEHRCGQVLDQPNTYTVVSGVESSPSTVQVISEQELNKEYGALIKSAPPPPSKYLLYFEPDSTMLTTQSTLLHAPIVDDINQRKPCDVNIIGHADRTGSKQYNIDLSLRRAETIRDWLLTEQVKIEKLSVESYGEEDPLIPTADDVAEPKNRRVEVMVR
jgi:outer membrane protein OmpA-like peptidoglycan-associated protein